jgi:hypothetical protein
MLVVLALGIGSIVAAWVAAKEVEEAVRENDAAFEDALDEVLKPGKESVDRLSEALLFPLGQLVSRAPEPADIRWVMNGTLADLQTAYVGNCEEALAGRGQVVRLGVWVGHSLIGIALLFTFALIAGVLASDVPAAIRGVAQTGDVQAAQAGTEALQRAVGLMGAKFAVSALGLALSLVFGWFAASGRERIAAQASCSLRRHRSIFIMAEDNRAATLRSEVVHAIHDLQALLGVRADVVTDRLERLAGIEPSVARLDERIRVQLREVVEAFQVGLSETRDRVSETVAVQGQAIAERLDQLASIEVSVKDVGNEVKAHLGLLMKQHVADQICDAMADLRVFADQIVQRLESGLTESITRLATEGLGQLGAALDAIQETIARQTQSDVERLISQMREMLSGGFQDESHQMTQVMASLRDMLPGLEVQLRRMTDDVDRQLRERSEDHQRLQTELVRQVQAVVAAGQQSQGSLEDLLGRLGRVAEDSAHELHSRLSASGEAALHRLTAAAADGLRDLQDRLGDINEIANSNVSTFGKEVAAAAETLAAARASLSEAVRNVAVMAADLRGGLAGARETIAAAERAGGVFSIAGKSIGDLTERTQHIVSTLGDRLGQEADVIAAQKALAAQVEERVVPALERAFTGYTRSVEEQSQKLQAGWSELAERVKQTVDACGAGLQDSVQQLVEQVDLLKRQLDRMQTPQRRP